MWYSLAVFRYVIMPHLIDPKEHMRSICGINDIIFTYTNWNYGMDQ